MDWGSLAGVLLAFSGIFVGQILEGGKVSSLFQPTAFLIVFAGTCGAVLLQNGLPNFVRGMRMAGSVFRPREEDPRKLVDEIVRWSTIARREGLLSLEQFIETSTDRFVIKGLNLIIDGVEPFKIREILDLDIAAYENNQRAAARIWESAGGYSPTIGILGAVMGLIHVMENLSDPARLGGGIAVAFVATIYGVGLANLLFLPIGGRLKANTGREVFRREMLADAFSGIASGDNPRVIEERLSAFFRT